MTLRPLAAAVAALVLGGCAAAPSTPFQTWTNFADHPRGYLSPGDALRSEAFLPPPPADGSARAAADLAAIRATRVLQGSARWSLAARDADVETPRAADALACALGVQIAPARTPTLVTLLARVMSDVDASLRVAKARYARPRPFVTQDAPICVPREDWLARQGSYPSGHAAAAWAWALVLSELAPDRAETVEARALAYGESRVVCGVHYPSDVEAGRLVGAAVVARLHADADFRAALARARRELAALRRSSPSPPPAARCTAEAEALAKPAF